MKLNVFVVDLVGEDNHLWLNIVADNVTQAVKYCEANYEGHYINSCNKTAGDYIEVVDGKIEMFACKPDPNEKNEHPGGGRGE